MDSSALSLKMLDKIRNLCIKQVILHNRIDKHGYELVIKNGSGDANEE